MSNNPYLHAAAASAYIAALVSVVFYSAEITPDLEGTIVFPILFLSTFVLSAALMAYLFFYQPIRLVLEGKHTEAVRFFARTLLSFAGITAVWVSVLALISLT